MAWKTEIGRYINRERERKRIDGARTRANRSMVNPFRRITDWSAKLVHAIF